MKKLIFTLLIAISSTIGWGQAMCHSDFYFNNNNGTVSFTDQSLASYDSLTNNNYIVSWNWNFGDGTTSNLQNPQHTFQPGLHTICLQITTNYGCSTTHCDTINILNSNQDSCNFQLWLNSYNATNANTNNGYAYVLTSDSAAYTYLWSNGNTSYAASNLLPGEYCVTVTSLNGCSQSGCVYVYANQDSTIYYDSTLYVYVQAQPSYSDSSCSGYASAVVSNNGLQNQYQYLWENGETSQTIYNLCPGYYCVTVTDNIGNIASACALVEDYNYNDTTNVVIPTDTTTNYLDSCFITGPIDSAWINDVYTNANGVYVEWIITQNGTTTVFSLIADIDSSGTYVVILNITCNGYKSVISLKDIVTVSDEDLQIDGVENIAIKNIDIYPNPANNFITIENCKNENYHLYNMQGINILSGIINESEQIDISKIASGCYILKVYDGNTMKVARFIK